VRVRWYACPPAQRYFPEFALRRCAARGAVYVREGKRDGTAFLRRACESRVREAASPPRCRPLSVHNSTRALAPVACSPTCPAEFQMFLPKQRCAPRSFACCCRRQQRAGAPWRALPEDPSLFCGSAAGLAPARSVVESAVRAVPGAAVRVPQHAVCARGDAFIADLCSLRPSFLLPRKYR